MSPYSSQWSHDQYHHEIYFTELKPDPETSPLLVSRTHTNTELLCLYKH